MSHIKTVCIEAPLSGDLEQSIAYARAAMHYCLYLNVAPFVSHLLYTQVLDDEDPDQRELGIDAGIALGDACENRWFFVDFGLSIGMRIALRRAHDRGQGTIDVLLGLHWRKAHKPTPTRGFA